MAEISKFIASLLDYPLGWMLSLPRDLTIVLVALGTSLLLTLVRKWTTDQNMMRRCRDDLVRLAQLKREAKQAGDKPALKRMQATEGVIKWTQMKAELLGLAVSIAPIALLATWAYERLEYLPPKTNQNIVIRAEFPLSSVDHLTHIVLPAGIETTGAPIQVVRKVSDDAKGVAEWNVRMTNAGESELLIRHRGETVRHPLSAGQRNYAAPVVEHNDGSILATKTVLEQPKFLGLVPGIDRIGFAPWLVAYLVLAVVMAPCLRRVLKVC